MPTLPGLASRARGVVEALRRRVERTILWRVWQRLLENEFVDRSVALAAKAFVSLMPLLIVITAFTPSQVRQSLLSTLRRRVGVEGDSLALVKQAFASPEATRSATGLFGLVLVILYSTSFTTALQRTYLRAWRRPLTRGPADPGRGLLWIGGVLALASMLGGLRTVFTGVTGTTLFLLVATATSIGGWWLTAWLMLRGEVRWRPLLTAALLTGVGVMGYALASAAWMPRTLRQDEMQFGMFGISLAFVTWFLGLSTILVVAANAAAEVADDPGLLGRWARGSNPSPLAEGAAPAREPVREPRFREAFASSDDDGLDPNRT